MRGQSLAVAFITIAQFRLQLFLRFYGNQRQIEHDVIVRPGAEPRDVRLAYEGIDGLVVNERGELEVYVKGRSGKREIGLIQHKPRVYQEVDGLRREVEWRFEVLKRDRARLVSF